MAVTERVDRGLDAVERPASDEVVLVPGEHVRLLLAELGLEGLRVVEALRVERDVPLRVLGHVLGRELARELVVVERD